MQTEMLPDIVRRVDRRQPACRSALPQAAFLPRKNSAGLFTDENACVSLSNEGMDFAKKELFLPIEINEH